MSYKKKHVNYLIKIPTLFVLIVLSMFFSCFVLIVLCFANAFVLIVLSDEPMQNQGRGLDDRKLVKALPPHPPSIFIAGHPMATLLFWFFGDFRYGALIFMVILVIYKYIICKNSC